MTMVRTVCGDVPPGEIGWTSMHEHLLVDLVKEAYREPEGASQRHFAEQLVSLENLGWVRHNWASSRDNCRLLDEDLAVQEVQRFRAAGGETLVDPTNLGIGRDPQALARISRLTGLHIVMGGGFYTAASHPRWIHQLSEGELAEFIASEVEDGVGETGIRSGLIGEIGCSWPLEECEVTVLKAAGRAQAQTGAPLMIHPGRDPSAPLEIIKVLDGVGANLSRTIIAHVDRVPHEDRRLKELCEAGCYIEFDLFGFETSYYPLAPQWNFLSDAERIGQIARLFDMGLGAHILTAQDICYKHRLWKYGGHGYDHLLRAVLPRMHMRLGREAVDQMLTTNPQEVLTIG